MKGVSPEKLYDGSLLDSIKVAKEHQEREIEQLLEHFSENNKLHDPLQQMGSSLNNRWENFRLL